MFVSGVFSRISKSGFNSCRNLASSKQHLSKILSNNIHTFGSSNKSINQLAAFQVTGLQELNLNPYSSLQLFWYSSSASPEQSDKESNQSGAREAENSKKFAIQVVETPSEFPFKIDDKPGEQTITLSRKYLDDEIKVIVHMPVDHSYTFEDNGSCDPQSSIYLVVSSTNYLGTSLEYGVIAYPDDFSVDSFCIKYAHAPEENIYYTGPDYVKLDTNLQKEFKRRLKIRGIIPSTTNFLHEYMANRDVYPSTTADQSVHESLLTPFLNDQGILVDPLIEQYRQRGHPLVSAEDIRNSTRKTHKDFVWIPYLYTRSEKPLWIEVPSKGFCASSESELDDDDDDSSLFLEGEEDDNPYRCLPPKRLGDPPVFSGEMDKILYPDMKHTTTDPINTWETFRVALKEHNAEMMKIKYPNGRNVIKFASDEDREYYQVHYM